VVGGASRGGYDPLCAGQDRHHKSQDQAACPQSSAVFGLCTCPGLLLGLAIPGLG
jgi:hypothetical protein